MLCAVAGWGRLYIRITVVHNTHMHSQGTIMKVILLYNASLRYTLSSSGRKKKDYIFANVLENNLGCCLTAFLTSLIVS
jgi:hypothetical protein